MRGLAKRKAPPTLTHVKQEITPRVAGKQRGHPPGHSQTERTMVNIKNFLTTKKERSAAQAFNLAVHAWMNRRGDADSVVARFDNADYAEGMRDAYSDALLQVSGAGKDKHFGLPEMKPRTLNEVVEGMKDWLKYLKKTEGDGKTHYLKGHYLAGYSDALSEIASLAS